MTEDMQVRNLALNTQKSYVQQVSLSWSSQRNRIFVKSGNSPTKNIADVCPDGWVG
jgi:hypothetical protein